jgi:predicted ATPase
MHNLLTLSLLETSDPSFDGWLYTEEQLDSTDITAHEMYQIAVKYIEEALQRKYNGNHLNEWEGVELFIHDIDKVHGLYLLATIAAASSYGAQLFMVKIVKGK